MVIIMYNECNSLTPRHQITQDGAKDIQWMQFPNP